VKREARVLLEKSIDSLLLSIEHFNRPWDRGREEAVLILLDRSFELMLKAAIVHKGGRIREPRAKETIGFDKCVRKCLTDNDVKCLTEDQALTIQVINSLRDAAQHYLLDISEQQLYMYAQAGSTLFGALLENVFDEKLSAYLPERVLPISTSPPRDLHALMGLELDEIRSLVKPKSRKMLLALAKVRAIATIEASLRGERSQPSEGDLRKLLRDVQENKPWQELFPGVASLQLDTTGTGLSVTLRLTKKEGEAVQLVPEGTPGATVVAVKRVDELSYYSLKLSDLAEKIGISAPKTLAVIQELGIQDNPEYFKPFKIGTAHFKRYSPKALDLLIKELPGLDIQKVWMKRNPARSAAKKK
jgi:hypothetical protein